MREYIITQHIGIKHTLVTLNGTQLWRSSYKSKKARNDIAKQYIKGLEDGLHAAGALSVSTYTTYDRELIQNQLNDRSSRNMAFSGAI